MRHFCTNRRSGTNLDLNRNNPNNDATTNLMIKLPYIDDLIATTYHNTSNTTTQSLINQLIHKWSSMSNNHNRHQWRNLLTFSTLFVLSLQCAYTLYKVHPTKFIAGHTSHSSTHNAPQKIPRIVHHKATPLRKASPRHDHHIAHLRTTTTNATTTPLKAQLRNSRPLLQHCSSQHTTTKLHNQHDHNMSHPQTPMCSYHVSTTT